MVEISEVVQRVRDAESATKIRSLAAVRQNRATGLGMARVTRVLVPARRHAGSVARFNGAQARMPFEYAQDKPVPQGTGSGHFASGALQELMNQGLIGFGLFCGETAQLSEKLVIVGFDDGTAIELRRLYD